MLHWDGALKLTDVDLYLDSRDPRATCFVSHAHSDHLGLHESAIATPATAALAAHRVGLTGAQAVNYRQPFVFDDHTQLELSAAGHVLGSAMLHVTRPEGTLLYTGDFKLRHSLTAAPADPLEADVLLMESTYGQPIFRFPPWQTVAAQLVERVTSAMRDGRQPIVMGYSLGKAQEIMRILTDAGIAVTVHGAVHAISRIYQEFGIDLGSYRRYAAADFHGRKSLDLAERGVLIAPPHVARTAFVSHFSNPCRIMMSGWGILKNASYRYGVDHVLPLSDHADFDELLELIERVHPKKIYTHHGYREFADILQSKGLDARLAQPEVQLKLFN